MVALRFEVQATQATQQWERDVRMHRCGDAHKDGRTGRKTDKKRDRQTHAGTDGQTDRKL